MDKPKLNSGVHFMPMNQWVRIRSEVSVLELAEKNQIPIESSCGGSGSCGACLVVAKPGTGQLSPRTDIEKAMAKDRKFSESERLACQIEPCEGIEILVPRSEVEDDQT